MSEDRIIGIQMMENRHLKGILVPVYSNLTTQDEKSSALCSDKGWLIEEGEESCDAVYRQCNHEYYIFEDDLFAVRSLESPEEETPILYANSNSSGSINFELQFPNDGRDIGDMLATALVDMEKRAVEELLRIDLLGELNEMATLFDYGVTNEEKFVLMTKHKLYLENYRSDKHIESLKEKYNPKNWPDEFNKRNDSNSGESNDG